MSKFISVELLIGAGAFIGVLLRFSLSSLAHDHLSATFPIGTLLVNLIGCFVIGIVQTIFLDLAVVRREVQLFVTVGLVGGFTTFSAISVDSVHLLAAGLTTWLLGYQIATLAGGLAAVLLGTALTQAIHQYVGRRRA